MKIHQLSVFLENQPGQLRMPLKVLAQAGVDIKTLAELMGHTTSRMTEHYVHLAGCQKHLAAAMLQAVGRRRDS